MPLTDFVSLKIDFMEVDFGAMNATGIEIDYILEQPENWQQKQASGTGSFTIPCSKQNDKIFNTYHNSDVIDTSLGMVYRQLRDAILSVNGSNILLKGKVAMVSATYTDKPGNYILQMVGGSGDWLIDMQNLTLWDCLNTTPHAFTVANIETSWKRATAGGYDSDEFHDYVYYPIRYRQPFGANDDTVNIYMLRPHLSIYWMIIRAFRLFGYSVKSDFLNTQYFRRQTMPWTWGDFYDINSQLTEGISFKAVGAYPIDGATGNIVPGPGALTENAYKGYGVWMALEPLGTTGSLGAGTLAAAPPQADTSFLHWESAQVGSGDHYIKSEAARTMPWTDGSTFNAIHNMQTNFRINYTESPLGYDNFGLYSFDEATGTMQWTYGPPAALAPFIGNNITAAFTLNLHAFLSAASGSHCDLYLEIIHYNSGGTPVSTTTTHIINASGSGQSGDNGCFGGGGLSGLLNIPFTNPWIYNFTVPNINNGDYLKMRLKWNASGSAQEISIASSFYLNTNPTVTGANPWQWNPITGQWANINGFTTAPVWAYMQSFLQLTGLQIQLGNNVHFQWYDAFRNKNFLDYFGGLVDTYDLEIVTNPVDMSVTIEPFSDVVLPDYDADGNYIGNISLSGYYETTKVVDWTDKQDFSQESTNELFSNSTRQIDFNFKQDGSDGGQNIYSARNLGIYLNNVIKPKINNTILDNGIIAGVPGASRYMLPNRFQKGNTQKQNRFFSPTMHYKATKWKALGGPNWPAPQLITIFPENINDSSASAVTQVFEPKIAFYAGLKDPAAYGGWRWIGDPNAPYTDAGSPSAIGFPLPYAFSVNYNNTPGLLVNSSVDPVLSYSDQLVFDNTTTPATPIVVPGLMRKFFLKRMAIMNNGDLKHAMMRLNLKDITNFEHREFIRIDRGFYGLISINGYKPISDESCECVLWKLVSPTQEDLDNCFPSQDQVLNQPAILDQYDLRYAALLLFDTDIPQIG